jgi:alpha-beta hydrolase superfamily lysophospholipase
MSTYILEKTFHTKDGTRLFYRHSDLSHPRRFIVLHGLNEHSGCYVPLMERIFPKGDVSWVALDLHGHGHSEGEKNSMKTRLYMTGIRELVEHLNWAEGSFIGLCHSFGSLLALHLTLQNPHFFKAMILSSPFLDTPDLSSRFEGYLFFLCSILFPTKRFYDQIFYNRLTHDKELIELYKKDSLITRRLSFEAIAKIQEMQREVKLMTHVEVPTLVLIGGKEKIVSLKAIKKWIANCQGEKLEPRFFKGFYHEVLKEANNENVMEEIQNFLKKYDL